MKPIIFDGKKFAQEKLNLLKLEMLNLNVEGKFPHLASIVVGDNPASLLYVNLKKKKGEEIGAQVDIYTLPEKVNKDEILNLINSLNDDSTVNGIMIQMPLPETLKNYKSEIINSISITKDVDGLREDSIFLHPTSKAVMDILEEAKRQLNLDLKDSQFAVIGSTGMVGRPLVTKLIEDGYKVIQFDSKTDDLKKELKSADIIISATGVSGLITPNMVNDGIMAIDVGSPLGDFNQQIKDKALFFTPVPGGVGPVTITCLLENLIKASKRNI